MRSYLEEIDFETIKQRFDAFWDREVLDRPLIYITAPRKRQKRIDFPVPESVEERWTNVEYVLKKMELYFENTLFLGDAIPWYLPNLGPDCFTAFLGADLTFRSEETSWAQPFLDDLSRYKPFLDRSKKWWRLMDRLLDAVCGVAEGNFLVGIPDIHYGGDSLVATVGARRLIRHMFCKPDEVKMLIRRLTDICCTVFNHYYEKISRVQQGSITWIPAYSRGRYFALQDDFSGLVSPKMFEEFFVEEVERLSKYLDNSIYHLDGPMALGNLDRLLEVDSLDGVQWVPGAGAKPMSEWVDVCAKVLNADKCLQIGCRPDEVDFLLSKLRHGGLFLSTHCTSEREAHNVLKIVEQHSR
ncbi:MAG: hypothetical protein ACE5NN_00360 [Candidatus Bathyarchaeia archaeon]